MGPYLIPVVRPGSGDGVPLGEREVSIGRDGSNTVVVDAATVSLRHCVIRLEAGGLRLLDLGSAGGTRVNGEPVRSRLLEIGDRIDVGGEEFELRDGDLAGGEDPGREALAGTATVPLPIEVTEGAPPVPAATVALRVEDARYLASARSGTAGSAAAADPARDERAARDLRTLLDLGRTLGSARDVAEIERRLLDRVFEVIPAERGAVLLLARGGGGSDDAPFASMLGRGRHGAGGEGVRVSRTIALRVASERTAVLANGVMDRPEWKDAKSLQAANVRSVLCLPLTVRERVLGVLYLDSSDPGAAFDPGHLELATAIAAIAGIAIDNAGRASFLEAENRSLRDDAAPRRELRGEGPRMREARERIARLAAADSTVLVRGESGTGKELAARAIHLGSSRAPEPFVAVSCAAIPESLVESELFGHERGAFTGAAARRLGRLELAGAGTLFLDEVGEIPKAVQAKLLRVLQERTFERVGGNQTVRAGFRLIAATNRDLEAEVRRGGFREDLYYRLFVLDLTLPPLRDRREDIPELAADFAARSSARLGRRPPAISAEALACLLRYRWPGNVRELENLIERAVVLGDGQSIRPEDLPEALLERPEGERGEPARFHDALNDAKRRIVAAALADADGVVTDAARRLGLNANYLHRLINNLGLRARP